MHDDIFAAWRPGFVTIRWRQRLEIEAETDTYEGDDLAEYVIDSNVTRRNMSTGREPSAINVEVVWPRRRDQNLNVVCRRPNPCHPLPAITQGVGHHYSTPQRSVPGAQSDRAGDRTARSRTHPSSGNSG